MGVFINYFSTLVGFQTPGLGRSNTQDWDVSGEHMAERTGLFIIIALGESILVAGATFAELKWNLTAFVSLAVAFAGSVSMWWIYFLANAEAGTESIAHSADPGRIARSAYTFTHMLIVAGIVFTAVGDEYILLHPQDDVARRILFSVVGGPLLFLLGNLLFKFVIAGRWALSHLAGMLALLVLAALAGVLNTLILALLTTLVLVVVSLWESRLTQMEMRRHITLN